MIFGCCSEWFPLPLGATDGLRYYIVALTEHSVLIIFVLLKKTFFFLSKTVSVS